MSDSYFLEETESENLYMRIDKPHYKEFNLSKIGTVKSDIKVNSLYCLGRYLSS